MILTMDARFVAQAKPRLPHPIATGIESKMIPQAIMTTRNCRKEILIKDNHTLAKREEDSIARAGIAKEVAVESQRNA